MPEAVFSDHRVWWREVGEGPRRAVVLHCSLAHSGALTGMMQGLGDLATCTAIDLPDHGRSGTWDQSRLLQNVVVGILSEILAGIEGPVDLIGHSFGGSAMLRVAFLHPGRVRSLTLYEPPFYDILMSTGDPVLCEQLALDAPVGVALAKGDRETAARHFSDGWGGPGGWDALSPEVRAYVTDRIHTIEGVGQVLNRDYAGLLRRGRMESLTMPVLLLRGDRSPISIPPIMAALAERLPNAQSAVIEGAGHMGPVTHAGPVAEAVRALFSRS